MHDCYRITTGLSLATSKQRRQHIRRARWKLIHQAYLNSLVLANCGRQTALIHSYELCPFAFREGARQTPRLAQQRSGLRHGWFGANVPVGRHSPVISASRRIQKSDCLNRFTRTGSISLIRWRKTCFCSGLQAAKYSSNFFTCKSEHVFSKAWPQRIDHSRLTRGGRADIIVTMIQRSTMERVCHWIRMRRSWGILSTSTAVEHVESRSDFAPLENASKEHFTPISSTALLGSIDSDSVRLRMSSPPRL